MNKNRRGEIEKLIKSAFCGDVSCDDEEGPLSEALDQAWDECEEEGEKRLARGCKKAFEYLTGE